MQDGGLLGSLLVHRPDGHPRQAQMQCFSAEVLESLKKTMLPRAPACFFTPEDIALLMEETGLEQSDIIQWADILRSKIQNNLIPDLQAFLKSSDKTYSEDLKSETKDQLEMAKDFEAAILQLSTTIKDQAMTISENEKTIAHLKATILNEAKNNEDLKQMYFASEAKVLNQSRVLARLNEERDTRIKELQVKDEIILQYALQEGSRSSTHQLVTEIWQEIKKHRPHA